MASGPPLKLAVFGKPVNRSLSPQIHNQFAAQCGLEVDYQAIEATAESFPGMVNGLASAGGRGCNITTPLKHEAWKLASRCSESATRAQAANTLVFDGPGNWFADSTDGMGLVNDLRSLSGCRLQGARVCLLGAGGAAASVLAALLSAGPTVVFNANRTSSRARELAQSHEDLGALEHGSLQDAAAAAPFDLIVNATSLGHAGGAPAISHSWLRSEGICYDMNYGKASAPLRALCEQQGIRYTDGLGMLVEQAALSFSLWTGRTPDPSAVLAKLRAATG